MECILGVLVWVVLEEKQTSRFKDGVVNLKGAFEGKNGGTQQHLFLRNPGEM